MFAFVFKRRPLWARGSDTKTTNVCFLEDQIKPNISGIII
jgi:hypothetical protein